MLTPLQHNALQKSAEAQAEQSPRHLCRIMNADSSATQCTARSAESAQNKRLASVSEDQMLTPLQDATAKER
jgi:BRCT domain type II-containing protein